MLRISKIAFPGLGIGEFSVNSTAFTIFGMEIAWYALIITFGMVCTVIYTVLQAKKIGITFDDVIDYALFTIPFGVIGARLYYVLSEIDQYDSFLEVINIREGGLAIYGGIIAGTITVFVVSHFKKINFFAFGDCVAPGVLLAQGIGRWGNFMNGEAFGYETDWFCRMQLQNILTGGKVMEVHPTFLYESLWNLLGVLLVYLFARYIGKKYDGQLILLTFGWYGLGRMFIEGLRTDSLYIGDTDIRVSQLLAGIIFFSFLAMLIYFHFKKPTKPLYHKVAAKAEADTNVKKAGKPAENKESTDTEEKIGFVEKIKKAIEKLWQK
ncbi:MAG: prolipoprotein diacylglyceryl transferase [Ruminococcaceae bacterium]|nr:prolipoprotein diacylglyceryl transferase [Oscillospiraceae bacterium]